ncbi:hypothetical protein ACPXA3_32015, partial [Klebsiella pneumoniae]
DSTASAASYVPGKAGISFSAEVSLGGTGGGGGAGAGAYVTNNGLVKTSGNFADGILAQSVGGGGGTGGV